MTGRCKPALCALLIAALLSGCASLWEREIYERTPHLTQEEGQIQAASLTAASYDELKSVIIGVIRDGRTEAGIRVPDYPGELTSRDISALLSEIQKWEPIGAYAVDYIVVDFERVLSQYAIALEIVYRHDVRPVITPISGRLELTRAVHAALSEYRPRLTVEMPVYYAQEHDVESILRAYYYSNPAWAMEYPKTAVGLYPPDTLNRVTLNRIIEMELNFQTPAGSLIKKARDTGDGADFLLGSLPVFSGGSEEQAAQTVLWLRGALCETVLYDYDTARTASMTGERQGGDAYTAYGALVNGRAVSEGYAMAFKLLCDQAGIDCLVATGSWELNDHAWNLVRIGGTWYHTDVALDDRGPLPVYDYFLLDDAAAELGQLAWDASAYPAALPGPWTLDAILALDTEEEEE